MPERACELHGRRDHGISVHMFRRCYNFIRPHSSLRFGGEVRTPAMQAGLAKGKLRFRDVFTFASGRVLLALVGTRSCKFDGGVGPIKSAA